MIQCVGSRNEENPDCSRICCQGAVKHALELKDLNPEMDVLILYRDMRTYGVLEDYYREARNRGVLSSRFDPERPPQVEEKDGRLQVSFVDHILNRWLTLPVDAVILSAATVAGENEARISGPAPDVHRRGRQPPLCRP